MNNKMTVAETVFQSPNTFIRHYRRTICFDEREEIVIEKLDTAHKRCTFEGYLIDQESLDTGRWEITSLKNINEEMMAKAISELLKDNEYEVIMLTPIKFYRASKYTQEEILKQIIDNKDAIEQNSTLVFAV